VPARVAVELAAKRLVMALSGHPRALKSCPLLGVKPTCCDVRSTPESGHRPDANALITSAKLSAQMLWISKPPGVNPSRLLTAILKPGGIVFLVGNL